MLAEAESRKAKEQSKEKTEEMEDPAVRAAEVSWKLNESIDKMMKAQQAKKNGLLSVIKEADD